MSKSSRIALAVGWLLAGAVMFQPSLVAAQQSASNVESAAATTPVGPVLIPSATYRPMVVELPGEQEKKSVVQSSDRSNVAWMAVGIAGVMVGSLIGGDAGTVVAVSGGVIALMGLFRYLQ